MKNSWMVMMAMVFGLSGCALKYPQPRNSKYSVDISEMKPSEVLPETWVYRHPTKQAKNYPKLWLSSFEIFAKPVHKIPDEQRKKYDALQQNLKNQIQTMLSREFQTADAVGDGVLELQVEVVDIKPIVHMKRNGQDVVLTSPDTKGAKFELNAIDSKEGDLVYAISTLKRNGDYSDIKNPALAAALEKDFPAWIQFLADSLKKAQANH